MTYSVHSYLILFDNFDIIIHCILFFGMQDVSEAEQIALESSGELLPQTDLVQRIQKDLQSIRSKFPQVADVKHSQKWQPGKLIVHKVNKDTLDTINKSVYGPLTSRPIFQDTIYVVEFTKPYNPEILAKRLEKELGIGNASPDGIIGSSSGITLTSDPSGTNTYVFYQGSGDCPAGCINKTYYTFTVDSQENVEQVEKREDDHAYAPVGIF